MKKGKNKKRIVRICILLILVLATASAAAACLPYAGGVKVSEQTKSTFNAKSVYAEGDAMGTESVLMLDYGADALYYRLDIIEKAREKILFVSYATHQGEYTDLFWGALFKAADRGVKIEILLDSKFCGVKGKYKKALTGHKNITYAQYNRTNIFKPWNINISLHDKFLICDNSFMIFGGRNVGDKYYAHKDYIGKESLDREVLVYNPDGSGGSIAEVKSYYKQLKSAKLSKESKKNKKDSTDFISGLKGKYNNYLSKTEPISSYADITIPARKISLISNPINGVKKSPDVAYALLKIAENEETAVIQTPYTILTKRNLEFLSGLAANTKVTVLTNSIAVTPNLPGFSNYYANRKRYLDAGLNIYEYHGNRGSLHAKTVMFGDSLTAIGSFNLDERSIRIDTESMLIIDSPEFFRHTKGVLKEYFDDSLMVGADNKYIQGDIQPKKASGFKRFVYKIFGKITNMVRYIL